MVSQKITVTNKSGLHARPASELVKVCTGCNSDIVIHVGERKVNPKSILNIMAAAVKPGTEILIECTGENEKEDLKKIIHAIESGLGE